MVSIIIPIYNVRDYVVKCLESVVEQTYTGAIECILIDDCGQDNSIRLAEDYVASYVGHIEFRIIHHDHNRGLSAARNTGILAAKGEWLYFLDSDDWITPDCIQLMIDQVQRHLDVEIVYAGTCVSTNEHRWLDYTQKNLPDYSVDKDWIQSNMLKRYVFGMTAWNKLINKSFILHNNLFFEVGYVHEDEIWNFRASSFIGAIAVVRKNTYYYTIRKSSIITQSDDFKYWDRLFLLWKRTSYYIKGRNIEMQVAGLCLYIVEKTRYFYPKNRRWNLFCLYCLLSFKSFSQNSFFYLFQGILAILYCKKYNNRKIVNRIILQ